MFIELGDSILFDWVKLLLKDDENFLFDSSYSCSFSVMIHFDASLTVSHGFSLHRGLVNASFTLDSKHWKFLSLWFVSEFKWVSFIIFRSYMNHVLDQNSAVK